MKKFFTFVTAVFMALTLNAEELTCAAAADLALNGNPGDTEYTVQGFVTSIAYAWKNGSMSFWMADEPTGGNVLEAYKCAIAKAEDAVKVGDQVKVTGKLTKFNTTPEFAEGCTCEIIARADAPVNLGRKTIAEFLALKNGKDTCVLRGEVQNIVADKNDATKPNAYGNFDLVDATGKVYVYGLLTPDGQSQKFREMGINAGDSITVKAVYGEYNGSPQAPNAVLVEGGNPTPQPHGDVTFLPADFEGQGVEQTGGEVTATKNGVTVSASKAFGHNLALRAYKGSSVTITSETEQIGKLQFQFYSTNTGGLDKEIIVNAKEWSVAELPSAARFEKIEIYFGNYEKPKVDTISVKQALEIGAALPDGAVTEATYVIAGYSSSIETYFSEQFKNETFWMTDDKESTASSNAEDAFYVYRGMVSPAEEMGVHAKVYVTSVIKKFMKSGAAIIETDGNPAVNVVEKGVEDKVDTITVEKALELGAALQSSDKNNKYPSDKRYAIEGYVSAVQERYSSYGNETFWITDKKGERTLDPTKAFEVYRGKPKTKAEIGLDGKIRVVCKLLNFGGTIENYDTNPEVEVLEQGTLTIDTITVAEAVEKTKALPEGSQSFEFYAVKGYIAQISSPYDEQYGNMSFYISDDQFASKSNFQCFRAKPAKEDVARAVKGAFVIVTGHLDNNSHGLQMYTGAEVFVGDAPQLDTLTVAKALEIGKALDEGASTDYYAIKGFVASILSDYEDELQSFVMSDDKEATSGEFRAIDALIDNPGAKLHDEILLIGKIENVNNVIRVVKGHATVNPGTGIQNVTVSEKAQKIMIDGVLYIIRDNKIFNVQGTQVR